MSFSHSFRCFSGMARTGSAHSFSEACTAVGRAFAELLSENIHARNQNVPQLGPELLDAELDDGPLPLGGISAGFGGWLFPLPLGGIAAGFGGWLFPLPSDGGVEGFFGGAPAEFAIAAGFESTLFEGLGPKLLEGAERLLPAPMDLPPLSPPPPLASVCAAANSDKIETNTSTFLIIRLREVGLLK
jgi:hypothetical protein